MGRGPSPAPASHWVITTWTQVNGWFGYGFFGLVAALTVIAVVVTAARFGLWDTVRAVALPVVPVLAPFTAWATYSRRRPHSRRSAVIWCGVAVAVVVLLWVSPMSIWAGIAGALAISEVARMLVVHHLAARATRREEAV